MTLMIGYPNRIDNATLSGGGWTTGLPLSYLSTRQLDQRGRTSSALKRDTWAYATFASATALGVAALCGNNFSTSAQARWRGFSADPRGVVDGVFTTGSLPSGWTVTRTGNATYFGSDGLLRTAGTDTARFNYTNGVCDGLLLEPGITNALAWCRDLTNAAWSKSSITAALTVTGIDGTANSATRLTASGANGTVSQIISAGTTGILSGYIRRVSGTGNVQLSLNNFSTTTNLTLTTSWQRFTLAGTTGGTGATGIRIVTSGDVIEVDYMQFEGGAAYTSPTSPILTTSGAGTRNPDTLSYATSALLFSAGALLIDGYLLARPVSSTRQIAAVDAGSSTNYCGFDMTTGGVINASVVTSSAQQVSGVAGSAVSANSSFAAAISWTTNDVKGAFDGGASAQDTTATMPSGTPTRIVVPGSASYYIRRVKAYAATKTGTQLTALSGTEKEVAADYDSGWYDCWPAAYVSGSTSEMRAVARTPAMLKLASEQSYRYWRFDVSDESNSAGYVEIGRPFIGSAWQPTYNASYGSVQVAFIDLSSSVRAYSGARYFEDQANPRTYAFNMDALGDSEAWTRVYEMTAQLGSTKEVLFSLNPSSSNIPRHTFLATLSALDGLTAASYGIWTKAAKVEELL